MDKQVAQLRLVERYGRPARETVKVLAWELGPIGVVLQVDQPNREEAAYIWLPYPAEGGIVPEIALEYPAESGRHSGTYASSGLSKGLPALKLIIRTERELSDTLAYIEAAKSEAPLLPVMAEPVADEVVMQHIDPSVMPAPEPVKKRREAIPRVMQREVWQRDGGRCVECGTKEKLCFDHIIPFSRGGSNTIRNLQLLCERCNLSKGNRI